MKSLEVKGRKIVDISFTQNRLFALTSKNEVYVWKINFELPPGADEHSDVFDKDVKDFIVSMTIDAVHIAELKNIVQIVTGSDHFLARDKEGNVWAMGDDTFGQ
jgi:alpha-tubulin suppressor-like RCC1 family protein